MAKLKPVQKMVVAWHNDNPFDLSVFPCAVCGKPAASEHYDQKTERLLKLCAKHKVDAVVKAIEAAGKNPPARRH